MYTVNYEDYFISTNVLLWTGGFGMSLFHKGGRKVGTLFQTCLLACTLGILVMLSTAAPAVAATTTTASSSGGNCPVTPQEAQSPKTQMRAVWVATVSNIDWPTATGEPIAEQQQQFITILDKVQQMHMNTVVVQVRPSADALYPSKLFPWSQYLTGVQGQDPGYDPLAFMIKEAHARNIQFQAWFNPYRISLQSDITKLAPNNPARLHPDWVIKYGTQLYFNPGIPAVREYITKGIMEVVNKYDVDGIHFDDYFYPYPVAGQTFADQATFQQYGQGFSNIGDWRRNNVNQLVKGVHDAIKAVKPYVSFGISPFGVWRNQSTDPTGSATTAGAQDYDDLYADTRTWIKHNWIDYITPQIYWNIGFAPAAYDVLVPWWAHEVEGTHVQLYIGMAVYKIGLAGQPAAWQDPNQMPDQLAFDAKYPEVQGNMYFSMKELFQNPLGFTDDLSNNIYKQPALVPSVYSRQAHPSHQVRLYAAEQTSAGVQLSWSDFPPGDTTSYAIYRFDENIDANQCDFQNDQNLLATLARVDGNDVQSFTDTSAVPGQTYTYYVTALNHYNVESWPGKGLTVGGSD